MTYEKTPAHEAYDLMVNQGLTQKEVAAKMGRTASAISGLKKLHLSALENENRDLEILRQHDMGRDARAIAANLDCPVRHVRQLITTALGDEA